MYLMTHKEEKPWSQTDLSSDSSYTTHSWRPPVISDFWAPVSSRIRWGERWADLRVMLWRCRESLRVKHISKVTRVKSAHSLWHGIRAQEWQLF